MAPFSSVHLYVFICMPSSCSLMTEHKTCAQSMTHSLLRDFPVTLILFATGVCTAPWFWSFCVLFCFFSNYSLMQWRQFCCLYMNFFLFLIRKAGSALRFALNSVYFSCNLTTVPHKLILSLLSIILILASSSFLANLQRHIYYIVSLLI